MKKRVFLMTPVASFLLAAGSFGQMQAEAPAKPTAEQAPPASPCPRVEVQAQSAKFVREGQPVIFAANIQGGDPKVAPQLIWSVSGGAIRDGQQTRKIEVDSTGAGQQREIVASLWVGGYPGECGVQQPSSAVRVVPPAYKADEFGELEAKKEAERLSAITEALGPWDDRLFVIAYAGRTSERGFTSNALKRMRAQLVSNGLDEARIGLLDGGYREQPGFEVWMVPQGAELPQPTPTVDRREIVMPRRPTPPARRTGRP